MAGRRTLQSQQPARLARQDGAEKYDCRVRCSYIGVWGRITSLAWPAIIAQLTLLSETGGAANVDPLTGDDPRGLVFLRIILVL